MRNYVQLAMYGLHHFNTRNAQLRQAKKERKKDVEYEKEKYFENIKCKTVQLTGVAYSIILPSNLFKFAE